MQASIHPPTITISFVLSTLPSLSVHNRLPSRAETLHAGLTDDAQLPAGGTVEHARPASARPAAPRAPAGGAARPLKGVDADALPLLQVGLHLLLGRRGDDFGHASDDGLAVQVADRGVGVLARDGGAGVHPA